MKVHVRLFLAVAVFSLISTGIVFAEEPAKRNWPESVDKVVGEVKKTVQVIDMEAFKKVVDSKGDAVIIDTREADEFAAGHVPGAINIPRGLVEFAIWKKLGWPDKEITNTTIYTYCKLGGRGILSAKALNDAGFKNVTAVAMKIEDWVKAGHPIER